MQPEEIQAEAERRYQTIAKDELELDLDFTLNRHRKSAFKAGCNFATSRQSEELREAVELLQAVMEDILNESIHAVGPIQKKHRQDRVNQIDQFLNRVKPKQ